MTSVTREQIESASISGLRNIYQQMTGKPTVNRNGKALRARLLGMLVAPALSVEPVVAVAEPPPAQSESVAKPDKSTRKKVIAERAKVKKTATKPQRKSHADSNTRKVLAELKPGQELSHAFRGGLTVKAKVVAPPDLNGEGGKFRHEGKTYTDLREIQREACNTDYNVLLFWGLAPWPKHRKKGEK
jgi:hypothetical protein